eukprot:1870217-Amphidinium_carterae.1
MTQTPEDLGHRQKLVAGSPARGSRLCSCLRRRMERHASSETPRIARQLWFRQLIFPPYDGTRMRGDSVTLSQALGQLVLEDLDVIALSSCGCAQTRLEELMIQQ